jgi:hypothetical protein
MKKCFLVLAAIVCLQTGVNAQRKVGYEKGLEFFIAPSINSNYIDLAASFVNGHRFNDYLGVQPGSVTPLALMNDTENHVTLFLDENLKKAERISFHPCVNTASIVLAYGDFMRFIGHVGNEYELLQVY